MKSTKAICILGGMGPRASAEMLRVLVDMASTEFGAKNGDDFPEILLDSIPVPDFISDKKRMPKALEILKKRVIRLSGFGVSNFGIACNTAHILLDDLRCLSSIPFISMIDVVSDEVSQRNVPKVGLLATPSTIRTRLYQKSLSKFGVGVVIPSAEQMVVLVQVIQRIISGIVLQSDSKKLEQIARSMELKGAEGIVLGCTELPLVFPKTFSIYVFDSVEILARALLIKHYVGGRL